MVILITGASHTGKTLLAQRMLEMYKYPYLSIDHLKMGLIRSGKTNLTPEDDDALTDELWPIVREMVKTAIENRQNPNVEILAYADNISVRCSGMVNFNVEDDVKRWIYDHNPVLPRLYTSYDQMEYFCLPIAEMDYYDLSPTPPVFQHFDLIAGEVGQGFVGERFQKK
jgi:adenylate kinase family enzyme